MYGYKGARDMPISLVKKIMTLDSVIGIKWTFPDFYTMEHQADKRRQLQRHQRTDEMFVCGLSSARRGHRHDVQHHAGLFVKAYNAHRANDIARATALQHGINDVIERLFAHNVIATTKAMLEYLGSTSAVRRTDTSAHKGRKNGSLEQYEGRYRL
jgi:dihydrodipicolinate synthase/N-acetylneuraminate lyase